jgi:hypothetical protein
MVAEPLIFEKTITPHVFADPAENPMLFVPPLRSMFRFDLRDDEDLLAVARGSSSALERERAFWEYLDRKGSDSLALLAEVARTDPDPGNRISALWCVQKSRNPESEAVLERSFLDDEPEVAEWAVLLATELHRVAIFEPRVKRKIAVDDSNLFDQTLPLLISGHAATRVDGVGWVRVTLSPKWFESIMGRVMACTRVATFASDLVIEKCIRNYHPDGSNHYETFLFRGVTFDIEPGIRLHEYTAEARHTFYPSGKVEDGSEAPLDDVIVGANRAGLTATTSIEHRPQVVQSVRGRYSGYAYVDPVRVARQLMAGRIPTVEPGEVQLSSPHHPVTGPLTNTLLYGTFKGKLSDLNGDGLIDVNTERCHGTLDGLLDRDLDGIPDADPFDKLCCLGR